jgi:protein TonB
MKIPCLKYLKAGIAGFLLCVFAVACNNESGNNSTTDTTTPATDSSGSTSTNTPSTTDSNTAKTATTIKKKGKASANMTAETADANAKMEMDKMGYYNRTEVLPGYNGGQTALENYITNNIEYPQDAIDNNMEGTVKVQFAVDEQGAISNVKAVGDKLGYGLEEEAIRVVSKMPKWTPGKIKGKNVKTWRTLPITYKLES